MRIAFLTDYLGTLAGTEASICETAECLRRAGMAVAVIVFPREEPPHSHWLATLVTAEIDIFVIDALNESLAAEEAWQYLSLWRADIVHAIPMGHFMLKCLAADGRFSCPIIATETSEGSERCTWYDETLFPALSALNAIIAPCRTVANNLRTHFRFYGRIEIIPHLLRVPEELIRPLTHHDLSNLPRLGSVTRLRIEKGISFMLASIALPTTPNDCTLSIYGETFEEDRARAMIRALSLGEKVEIKGPFAGRDMMERIHAKHPIMLLSSLFEGLPLALLNAIARGRIGIATDVGGVREILGDDAAGIVVPAADPTAMSLAISDLTKDPGLVMRCSDTAVEIFRTYFHSSKVLARMLWLYRDLVG